MSFFKVTVEGAAEEAKALGSAAEQLQEAIDDGLREGGAPIVYDLQAYPAPVPGSPYVRTFNYQQSVTPVDATIVAPGVFEASATVDYAVWERGVITGGGQAPVHVGRWQTLVSIRDSRIGFIAEVIARKIEQLMARLGI